MTGVFKVNHYTLSVMLCKFLQTHQKKGEVLTGTHFKGHLVPSRKQVAYKISGTKGIVSDPKRVPRPLLKQDSTYKNRQHHSGCLYKQGRRHEVGHTVCPSVENSDLVFLDTRCSQGLTHFRLVEYGRRQTIQVRSDHPDRVVYPSRGLHLVCTNWHPYLNVVQ